MKTLLKLKSWQLFVILFTPFIISSVASFLLPNMYLFLSNIWIVFYLIWLYAINTSLYHNLENNKNRTWFTIFQVFSILAIVCLLLIPISTTLNIHRYIKAIIYILSGIGVLFSIGYSAKTLTLSDKNQNSLFLNLILLWFYPIGLWIIQPKLKTLIKK